VPGKKKTRRTYRIEKVDIPSFVQDKPCLFVIDDDTQIVMPGASSLEKVASGHAATTVPSDLHSMTIELGKSDAYTVNTHQELSLNTDGIGGLAVQCELLNECVQRVLKSAPGQRFSKPAILLYGYSGTGKTLLLEQLAKSPFQKVIRIDRSRLNGGTIAKNQSIIRDSFEEARNNQPSLVIMDNLEKLVPIDDAAYATDLARDLATTYVSRVMVVGATRKPSDLTNEVLGSFRFAELIEFPVPDQAAREQILTVLSRSWAVDNESISLAVAARTHGFTSENLVCLQQHAWHNAWRRAEHEWKSNPKATAEAPTTNKIEGSEGLPAVSSALPGPLITLKDFDKALADRKVTPEALREFLAEKPKIRWDDIGGSENMKASFDEIIGWPLQLKDTISAIPTYKPTKGVLLYGPPGCSKTLTAQAVANTYDLNFIAIKGAALISMYVGESERAVREVFAKARVAAPCVIFFDEIDAIGSDRDGGGTKGLNVLTTLLNEMDGFEPLKDVFILAATNKPESLDPALIRPGRFDSHVYLGPPNTPARKEILKIATKGAPSDADLDPIALETEGYSGAEIVQIVHLASRSAFRRVANKIDSTVRLTQDDFTVATKSTPRGITREMLEAYEKFAARGS
jgi:AAA family ATPase